MTAPRSVHLLSADEALAQGYRHGGYLALCGEPIDTSSLPSTRCPDECDCEVTYCPGCLDVATERNWEAGVAVGCPPGITVVTGTRGVDQWEYLDGEAPMPRYLIPELLFDVLMRAGLLSIGEPYQSGWKRSR